MGRKRKWVTVDTVSFANIHQARPSEVLYALNCLAKAGVCTEGGVSKVYNRYRLTPPPGSGSGSGSGEGRGAGAGAGSRTGPHATLSAEADRALAMDALASINTASLTTVVYDHANEIQRRALVRVEEAVTLLHAGTESQTQSQTQGGGGVDMWSLIGGYFGEESSLAVADTNTATATATTTATPAKKGREKKPADPPPPLESSLLLANQPVSPDFLQSLPFDAQGWAQVVALVESGDLPRYDDDDDDDDRLRILTYPLPSYPCILLPLLPSYPTTLLPSSHPTTPPPISLDT